MNKKFWLIFSVTMPLVWLLELKQYLLTACVSFRGYLACGQHGLLGLAILFIFCFSFPVIYIKKITRSKKSNR